MKCREAYLAPCVYLALALAQGSLDERSTFIVDDDPEATDVRIEHAGSLHVFARSDDVAPRLVVRLDSSDAFVEELGERGGASAYVRLDVAAGDRATIDVRAEAGEHGEVLLGWALAVETDALQQAAADANVELDAIAELRDAGSKDEARQRVAALIPELVALDGAATSAAVGETLYHCAQTARGLHVLDAAEPAYVAALASRERLRPPDHPDVLSACQGLAITLATTKKNAEALPLFERVLAIRKRILPADHLDIPVAASNVATVLRALGRVDEAVRIYEESYATIAASRDEDNPAVVQALFDLGSGYVMQRDYARARPLLEAARDAWREQLGPGHRNFQVAQQNLAIALEHVGDVMGAAELEQDVYRWRRANLPPDHPHLLDAMRNLTQTLVSLRDFEGARVLAEETLEAQRRAVPEGHRDRFVARRRLSNCLLALGEVDEALAMDEALVAEISEREAADHRDVLSMKAQLARSRNESGDLRGALELEREVLAVYERTLAENDPARLIATLNVGATLVQLGEYPEALVLLERVRHARRALPVGHTERVSVDRNLLSVLGSLRDRDRARVVLGDLLEGLLARAENLRTLPPRLARADARYLLSGLSAAIAVRAKLDLGHEREAFEALESLRSISTASSELAWAVGRYPELRTLRDRLGAARRELQDVCLQVPEGEAEVREWERRVAAGLRARDQADRDLRKELEQRGLVTSFSPVERLRGSLEPTDALVSYFRTEGQPQPADPETGVVEVDPDHLIAFVVTRERDPRAIDLGPADEIERLVERWRGAIGSPLLARGLGLGHARVEEEVESEASRELWRRVLDPCLEGLANLRRVHVVPDDALHLVPLDALERDDGTRVGEGLQVRVEVSTRRIGSGDRPASEGTFVAVGGVDFGAGVPLPADDTPSATRSALPTRAFDPLPFTVPEVEAIAELFRAGDEATPRVLTGAGATKEALVAHAGEARFLHVATHGWFAGEEERLRSSERATTRTLRGLAPETLCGLALAGANHGLDPAGAAEGILTAEELAGLDLSRCELAVLSACETNVGIRRAGQGVQSLKGALHAAGARSAVTSLWRVDDASTRRLMELFYRGLWEDGLGKAEALWAAKRQLASDGRPTRDWAGWVLTGNPD